MLSHLPFVLTLVLGADVPPAPLTYAAARARARENHPAVLAAQDGARAAAQRVPAAGAWADPMVGLSLYQLPLDNLEGALRPGLGAEQRAMTLARGPGMVPVMVMASQAFPWPGKRGAAQTEARAMAEQQHAATNGILADLDRALVYALAEGHAARQSLAVLDRNARVLEAMVEVADMRLSTGAGSQVEALAARTEREGLARDRLGLQQQARVATARLAALLGWADPSQLPPVAEQVALREMPARAVLLASALDQRPELAGARAALKAAQARSQRAALEVFPDVTVNASYMLVTDGPGMLMDESPYRALLGPADMVSVGVSIPLPLLAPWKQNPQADAARLDHRRAQREAEALARVVQSEVDEALAALDTARAEFRLHDEQLIPLAEQNVQAARSAYEVGQGNLQLFLDAVRTVRGHHLEREVARVRFARAAADLQRATGQDVVRFEPVTTRPNEGTP